MAVDLAGALAAVTIATASFTLLFVFYLLRPEERDRLQEKRLSTLKRLRALGFLALAACQSGVLAYRFWVGTIVTSVYDAQLAAPAGLWATALVGHGLIPKSLRCACVPVAMQGLPTPACDASLERQSLGGGPIPCGGAACRSCC